uniref:RxLR effector protein n=1 Tax=Phytophthora foliorum TaxID=415976 RepID=C0J5H8_9STRA|nr:putative effector protein Avh121 [Phytophthora foliorum]
MRMRQLFLLVISTFIALCSTIASADHSTQVNAMATDSTTEFATEGCRYLKGGKTATDLDLVNEERFTPSFGMLTGALKLPKFQGLSKLPLVKQVAASIAKFGKTAGDQYLKLMKKRYQSNPQNFM